MWFRSSTADSYRGAGNRLENTDGQGFAEATESWYFLSAVEVDAGGRTDAVALFGDSIADGFDSAPGANRRWSDALAERTGRPVLNAGIGGNLLRLVRREGRPPSRARRSRPPGCGGARRAPGPQ